MREYSDALEKCRQSFSPQREYNELRSEFFLTATRYGVKIYPNVHKFIDQVRFAMRRLGAIEDEAEMIRRLHMGLKECKGLEKRGKDLEAQGLP